MQTCQFCARKPKAPKDCHGQVLEGDHLEHVHVIPCPSISNGISNGISMERPKNVSTQMVSGSDSQGVHCSTRPLVWRQQESEPRELHGSHAKGLVQVPMFQ